MAEINRDEKKRAKAFTMYDFHPFRKRLETEANWEQVKQAFQSVING